MNQSQTVDAIETMLLRIVLSFLTAIVIIYILKPILGLFAIMPSTGNSFADAWMFIIVPIGIVFIAVYRIFKIWL